MAPSRSTESTEALTNTDWSKSSLISMPGGAEARATFSAFLTSLTTSTVEALPFLITLSRTERLPSDRTTFCCTSEPSRTRSEEHTSELQSRGHLVCRLLLEKKKERPPWYAHRHPDSRLHTDASPSG